MSVMSGRLYGLYIHISVANGSISFKFTFYMHVSVSVVLEIMHKFCLIIASVKRSLPT